MPALAGRRLAKELAALQLQTPVGIELLSANAGDLLSREGWKLSIEVLGESSYKDQKFILRFQFNDSYPIVPPAVMFITGGGERGGCGIPLHPHIYSNGMICADILGNAWSPVLNVASVCITLQSMLASNKKLERPPDNAQFVSRAPTDPRKVNFVYHDDTV